ncbi:MAG: hypothetical protein JWQ83_1523 [Lacunisphaera sp.]|nr:hypothetical protein [Lacunisphaera sp.]
MPSFEPRPKITVEDLLRLKRAERPEPGFWNNFERELRQKQLTALLEKRPWWQTFPQVLTRRAYLPIGATAILAFTVVSLKYRAPIQIIPAPTVNVSAPVVDGTPSAAEPASPVVAAPIAAPALERNEPATAPAAMAAAPTEVMSILVAPPTVQSPSARSIAANLARFEQAEPEMVNAVSGNRLSPPPRVQAAVTNASELASVPPETSRRNRILAQYSDRPLSPAPTAPEMVRERLARRLVDPEISERLSRVGLKGDQLSLGVTLRL